MISRMGDISVFSKRAQELDRKACSKLERSIIKYTVRDYFLRNNVTFYGEAQSLLDHFFREQPNYDLKMENARKRIIKKDRT